MPTSSREDFVNGLLELAPELETEALDVGVGIPNSIHAVGADYPGLADRKLIAHAECVLIVERRASGLVFAPMICTVANSATICWSRLNRYSTPSAPP